MRRWEGSEEAAAAGRKRKGDSDYSPEMLASSVQLKTRRLETENRTSPASSENSICETDGGGEASSACCSSCRSRGADSKFVDLEVCCCNNLEEFNSNITHEDEVAAVEFLTESAGDSVDVNNRSDKTPLREAEFEYTAAAASESNSTRRCTAEKIPTVAELENFFVAAEKDLQKQFIDKYNYDLVEDKPLEGQYEWVQIPLKP